MGRTLVGKGIGAPDFVKDLRQVVYLVSTDEDTNFTEAIAKNGVERENVTGLRTDRVRINKIAIQSTQQLHYQLLLYGTDEFEESDLGADRYIADIEFDLPYYGYQQTVSQYRMELDDLGIDYEDLDKSQELHLVLRNLSPTSKSAYPSSEVKLEFSCEARA